ncbi:lysine N(6)-hydroxylase/L-ornithine N(5)-oxygenase family protein [Streptomyces sp. NPDC051018]|uniref:lysine N(6)-hydroxylase/L-ornithine N(5)-oxygenase family protein n=1 Tax=Streptomyces sp. NPDC051018 TaxID=3365639 RepID=UPI0037A06973
MTGTPATGSPATGSPATESSATESSATTQETSAGSAPAPGPWGDSRPRDLVGIGIGPFNLSLAALADGVHGGLDAAFYDQRPHFSWHSGILIEGTTLQVPFLADLVTLADPSSPWSFLSYLRSRERLFPFYFAEKFHIHRAEYDAYCRWVSGNLPSLRFGHQIDAVRWNPERDLFEIDFTQLDAEGEVEALGRTHARNVVLGVGSEPYVPDPLRPLTDAPAVPVIHSADYLAHRDRLLAAGHVTVVGSGQSGAEVFLDLLKARPAGAEGLHWLARTEAFTPMEYSKLGLEHFTPDYSRYFHALPQQTRDQLLPGQWQLHKGIDAGTVSAIHEELYRRSLHGGWPDAVLTPGVLVRTAGRVATTKVELHLEHVRQGTRSRLTTDAVVLATGYRERPLGPMLAGLDPYMRYDSAGRPRIDEESRMVLDSSVTGSLYVQNAGTHSHGVGAPDLGLVAWRNAGILNSVTGREPYPMPRRTAFTSFGLERHQEPVIPGQGRELTPLAHGA